MLLLLFFYFDLALDLRKVINELGSVASKWFQIGIQLGVSETRLHQIEADHRTADRCFSEVIIFWLNGNTNTDVNWESLIGALKASVVNEKGLAKSLIQKYGVATSVSKSECLHNVMHYYYFIFYVTILFTGDVSDLPPTVAPEAKRRKLETDAELPLKGLFE